MRPTLCVVVPVGARDNSWHGLLPQLQHVVADEIALVLPIDCMGDAMTLTDERLTLVVAPLGRARQMNAGADATQSDWLLFLDPDSRLEPARIRALNAFVASDFSAPGRRDRSFAEDGTSGPRLASRWTGPSTGRSGFIMSRRAFDAIGEFDESPENARDCSFNKQVRGFGIPLHDLPATPLPGTPKYEHVRRRTPMDLPGLTWQQARAFLQADTTP